MSKRTAIITAVVAAITLAAVPLVYAQHAMRGMHAGPFGEFGIAGRLAKAKEVLGLSDAQVDELQQIAADLREQNAPYRQKLHGGLVQVAQTLINDPANVAGAQTLLDQQNAAEGKIKTNALNAAAKALAVLTPDQRAKVADFISKHAAMHNQ